MATFIIGGLWHGAGWTFVFWGFLHGLALMVQRLWSMLGLKIWTWLAWFITFNFVNIAWIFFRAKEWDDAIKVLNGMFFGSIDFNISTFKILSILIGFFIILILKNTTVLLVKKTFTKLNLVIFYIVFLLGFVNISSTSEFLYFRF